MQNQKIYDDINYCPTCYFRTTAEYPYRKCLIQLTQRCNLHCEHCFVKAENDGDEICYEKFENKVIPWLVQNQVSKVTLTGGEPFVYSRLRDVIKALYRQKIAVSICTNATLVTSKFLDKIESCNEIHFNVSLDGFSPMSHGRFRGNQSSKLFDRIINNISLLGDRGVLNGVLITPNKYSSLDEYIRICEFAKQCGAKYVLMNPLSQFGRGEDNIGLAYDTQQMQALKDITEKYNSNGLEMVYVRFPNFEKKPLSKCVAGQIMYIFTDGKITYCPYMVFAARDSSSLYDENEFIVGNVFDDDCKMQLSNYEFPVKYTAVCKQCNNKSCQKGCYASKIAQGKRLTEEEELCPFR